MNQSMFSDSEPFLPQGDGPLPSHTCVTHARQKVANLTKEDGFTYLDDATFEPTIAEGEFIVRESLIHRPDHSVIIARTIKRV